MHFPGEGQDLSANCLLGPYVLLLWLSGKELACQAGDTGSIPGSERSPREGNGNPSSILALRVLWTEEQGGLRSTGSESDTSEHTHTLRSTGTYVQRPVTKPSGKEDEYTGACNSVFAAHQKHNTVSPLRKVKEVKSISCV